MFRPSVSKGKLVVAKTRDETQDLLKVADIIISVDGTALTPKNARKKIGELLKQKPGTSYILKVKREGKILPVDMKTFSVQDVRKNFFELNPKATAAQKKLRALWLKNF